MKVQTSKNTISVINFINVFISAILAVLFFYEYFFAANARDYPFGAEGPLPDYYRSRESYLLYISHLGFLFTGLLIASIFSWVKNNRVIGLSIFFTIITLIAWILVGSSEIVPEGMSARYRYGYHGGRYTMPHDSTIGVPNFVFMFTWVLIILFLLRLAWEYRDKIFTKNEERRPVIKNFKRKKD